MALVPHITDKNRDKTLGKIDRLIKKGGPEAADQLLDEHNVKVGDNDKRIVTPDNKVSVNTAKQSK